MKYKVYITFKKLPFNKQTGASPFFYITGNEILNNYFEKMGFQEVARENFALVQEENHNVNLYINSKSLLNKDDDFDYTSGYVAIDYSPEKTTKDKIIFYYVNSSSLLATGKLLLELEVDVVGSFLTKLVTARNNVVDVQRFTFDLLKFENRNLLRTVLINGDSGINDVPKLGYFLNTEKRNDPSVYLRSYSFRNYTSKVREVFRGYNKGHFGEGYVTYNYNDNIIGLEEASNSIYYKFIAPDDRFIFIHNSEGLHSIKTSEILQPMIFRYRGKSEDGDSYIHVDLSRSELAKYIVNGNNPEYQGLYQLEDSIHGYIYRFNNADTCPIYRCDLNIFCYEHHKMEIFDFRFTMTPLIHEGVRGGYNVKGYYGSDVYLNRYSFSEQNGWFSGVTMSINTFLGLFSLTLDKKAHDDTIQNTNYITKKFIPSIDLSFLGIWKFFHLIPPIPQVYNVRLISWTGDYIDIHPLDILFSETDLNGTLSIKLYNNPTQEGFKSYVHITSSRVKPPLLIYNNLKEINLAKDLENTFDSKTEYYESNRNQILNQQKIINDNALVSTFSTILGGDINPAHLAGIWVNRANQQANIIAKINDLSNTRSKYSNGTGDINAALGGNLNLYNSYGLSLLHNIPVGNEWTNLRRYYYKYGYEVNIQMELFHVFEYMVDRKYLYLKLNSGGGITNWNNVPIWARDKLLEKLENGVMLFSGLYILEKSNGDEYGFYDGMSKEVVSLPDGKFFTNISGRNLDLRHQNSLERGSETRYEV